jgi:hypothetical protein
LVVRWLLLRARRLDGASCLGGRDLSGLHGIKGVESAHSHHMKKKNHQEGMGELHVRFGTIVLELLFWSVHGCGASAEPTGTFRSHRIHGLVYIIIFTRYCGY